MYNTSFYTTIISFNQEKNLIFIIDYREFTKIPNLWFLKYLNNNEWSKEKNYNNISDNSINMYNLEYLLWFKSAFFYKIKNGYSPWMGL